jgi:DNA/RNA-binding domain of Phe-tRNA-synthetase-like protein
MQPKFLTDSASKKLLAGLKIGYIVFRDLVVEKSNTTCDILMANTVDMVRKRFPDIGKANEDPVLKACRSLYSAIGVDPTKDRPSGEALIRRVASGNGIYRINTVVDTNNAISMSFGHPCGVYDLDKIVGTVAFKLGASGEKYAGITGKELDAENKILTSDEEGIFGGPTADSARTSVTLGTKSVLMLIYHPPNAPQEELLRALEMAKKEMVVCNGGKTGESGIFEIK